MNDQNELDVVAEFRRRLDGLPEPRRRAPRLIPVAAAAVAAAVAIVVLLAGSGDGTSQALAITRQADWIELRIADVSAGPEQMNRELREAGINGRIALAPVPPEKVGVWILESQTAGRQKCIPREGQRAPDIERKNSSLHAVEMIPKGRPTTLRLPLERVRESSANGSKFLFVAGRPAKAGEPVTIDEDRLLEILEPSLGEPSGISRELEGLSPSEVRAKLRELTCKPGQQP
jgi:hypothetical protein